MLEELEGRHLCLEGIRVFEFLVPRLIHHRHDEGATGIVDCFIQLPVVTSRFVFYFGVIDLQPCGIFINVVIVEWYDKGNYISPILVDMFITLGR